MLIVTHSWNKVFHKFNLIWFRPLVKIFNTQVFFLFVISFWWSFSRDNHRWSSITYLFLEEKYKYVNMSKNRNNFVRTLSRKKMGEDTKRYSTKLSFKTSLKIQAMPYTSHLSDIKLSKMPLPIIRSYSLCWKTWVLLPLTILTARNVICFRTTFFRLNQWFLLHMAVGFSCTLQFASRDDLHRQLQHHTCRYTRKLAITSLIRKKSGPPYWCCTVCPQTKPKNYMMSSSNACFVFEKQLMSMFGTTT